MLIISSYFARSLKGYCPRIRRRYAASVNGVVVNNHVWICGCSTLKDNMAEFCKHDLDSCFTSLQCNPRRIIQARYEYASYYLCIQIDIPVDRCHDNKCDDL